ncbi:MAG: MFS transporter [Gammaproteobacteria bacterium]
MQRSLLFSLIIAGTVIGLAGTDLVLPAIPRLPDTLEGNLAQAQLVLATFTAGTAIGLLIFGELGARFDQKRLLIIALLGYACFSFLATICTTINALSLVRLLQGFMAAAPAVFAPGMIRALFADRQALRALGLMGSIESVVPALAPVAGAWLLLKFGWISSFYVTCALALILALVWLPASLPASAQHRGAGSYLALIRDPVFQRYALSQACALGALLIFVFGAPTVMTVTMGGTLTDFITMQIIGISLFIITTNLVHRIVDWLGSENTILLGTSLTAAGCLAILAYASRWHPEPEIIWFLFAFVNIGIGLRGPPGFYLAILASGDDNARGAALVMLSVFLIVAGGTALLAPFITLGMVPLAAVASIVGSLGVILLLRLPQLELAP